MPFLVMIYIEVETQTHVDFLMFIYVFLTHIVNVIRPIHISYKRPPQSKHATKILDTIEEIVLDAETYSLVQQVTMQHEASECVPFLKAILDFRQITDQKQLDTKALAIYDEFIKQGAVHQNNLHYTMVRDIERSLQQITSDLFNGPYREIMKLLKTNYLPEVKMLPEYQRIVREREEKADKERRSKSLFNN